MLKKLALFVIVVLSFSCKSNKLDEKNKNPNNVSPVNVDIVIAAPKSVTNTVETNGTVLSNELLEIHPETNGRLIFLNIPEGKMVTEGTILARINDADLQAQLSKSKVQLELAKKTEERLKKLLSISGINQADYDIALNNVNNLKADIEIIKAQIDKTIIKAPFEGTLGLRNISPGAYVTSQTIIATLQQKNKVKIDFTVPEQYTSLVSKGSQVEVLSNNSNNNMIATVVASEPEINANTRNLKVRALLNNGNLQAGSFVKVVIKSNINNKSIFIPTNAIIPDADSKKLVVIKEGKGKYISVETGLRTATSVEITKGINVGDSVIVTGVLFVKNNAAVKVKKVLEN